MFRRLKTGSAKKCNRAVEVCVNFNPEDIAFWFGLAEVSTNTGAAQIGQAGVPIVIKFVVCTTENSKHFPIKHLTNLCSPQPQPRGRGQGVTDIGGVSAAPSF
jgi:hypothetical protein